MLQLSVNLRRVLIVVVVVVVVSEHGEFASRTRVHCRTLSARVRESLTTELTYHDSYRIGEKSSDW